jgi:hypothetical protein
MGIWRGLGALLITAAVLVYIQAGIVCAASPIPPAGANRHPGRPAGPVPASRQPAPYVQRPSLLRPWPARTVDDHRRQQRHNRLGPDHAAAPQ